MSDQHTVAIDLGGTNCRAAVIGATGEILCQEKVKVDHGEDKPSVVIETIKNILQQESATKAVVGIPGIIDYELQRAVFVPNVPQSWIPHLTAPWISNHTGLEVSLANDADLAGVGEARFGAGRLSNDVVYVTISTGIGGAAILGGKLVHGKYAANDIGHVMVDLTAAQNGGSHTPEMIGSGPNLEAAASEAGLDVTCSELVEMVRSGDDQARKIFETGIFGAAAGIVNLAWLYAPQTVVIGGGVGLNGDLVIPVIEEALEKYGPKGVAPAKVVNAELGDSAALVGAAGWWPAFT